MQKPTQKSNRLIHGDCITEMQKMSPASVDLILTDPPYLVGYKDRNGRSIQNDIEDDWLKPSVAEMARLLKPNSHCISFYGWNKADKFLQAWKQAKLYPVGHIVFQKEYASKEGFLKSHHECAYLLAKGRPTKPTEPIKDILQFEYTGNQLHPTQKPVVPLERLIETFSKPNDVILDPFCGSGTTAVAAANTKRRFIAIEKDETYYKATHDRLVKHYTQLLEKKRSMESSARNQDRSVDLTR